MKVVNHVLLLAAVFIFPGFALAQELFVYPAEGQGKEQQESDKYQCYTWAKAETGFDPMALPTATEPPPEQGRQKGGAGRGLLRGAAVGAVIDGSDGAKKGAVAGGMIGGMRRRDQRREQIHAQEQWEQEQQELYLENHDRYNRAYGACLEARGYTVS